MRKSVLLPGLCLLLCASVLGIHEPYFDGDWTGLDHLYNYYDHYSIPNPQNYYYLDESPDTEEEEMLKMEILKTLVEDVEEAARAIASETVSDTKRRNIFGKLGHLIKPILKPIIWHKPHIPHVPHTPHLPPIPQESYNPPSTDVGVDINAEIVIPPPTESSEQEE